MSETLQIEREGSVARVWLNRPEVRNAFNDGVIGELRDTFERFAADHTLRAVVLGGRGKAFCAGADLSWMKRWPATPGSKPRRCAGAR
jgi:methylglutaconyl-CoA hydratase